MTRIKSKLIASLIVIAMLLALALPFLPASAVVYADVAAQSSDVSGSTVFSADTVYQIVTDRFYDGDETNNPTGDIFDKSDLKKYHGGDWAGITKKINDGYITDMGITAIWISSPVENITSLDPSNKSAAYHGYWGRDFFRTNSYFGSMDDFTELIETAHGRGIKIIIDFAPNHTSTAEYGDMVFPEDGRLYRDGEPISGFKDDVQGIFNHEGWTDFQTWENSIYHSMYGLADLNQMNNIVDNYLKDSIDMWLNLGVDGIRVDAVKHMPMGWQTNWLSDIYEKHEVFVFGEWFNGGTDNDAEMTKFANESGMSLLEFRLANAIRGACGNLSMSMQDLYNVMVDREKRYDEINDQVTFIDNHDMSRFMTLANGNARALENAYVLMMTSSGIPTVYYGSEQYATGESDPDNRGDMPAFSKDSTAYKVISELAALRKNNPALASGKTRERWVNADVLVYERTFGSSVVLTAVNRNTARGYDISGAGTSLPDGRYADVLSNLLGGGEITVGNGNIGSYYLGAGQAAVWQYTATSEDNPEIGNVGPLMGIVGNKVTITGVGFGKTEGIVRFGATEAQVVSWSDGMIRVSIPEISAGYYNVEVVTASGQSAADYAQFKVLSGSQAAVRFLTGEMNTSLGQNVYVYGDCVELGGWDKDKAIGPFFNATESIAMYPNWFYDISVPKGRDIEYKFIIKDSSGNIVCESGTEHLRIDDPEATIEKSDDSHRVRVTWTGDGYSGKLNGESYVNGDWIEREGEYTFVITDADNRSRTYKFTVGHYYASYSVVAPTCTEDGYTVYRCTGCGDSYNGDFVEAEGHKYGEWTSSVEPTCTASGEDRRKCENCSHAETKTVNPLGHDYAEVEVAPTCTEDGYRGEKCRRCEDEVRTETLQATGHNYELKGTEEADGEIIGTYVCADCGATTTRNMGKASEAEPSRIERLFGQYRPYMWWAVLATAGAWSVVMGVLFAVAQKNNEKEKVKKMIKIYVIGIAVIFAVLVVFCILNCLKI